MEANPLDPIRHLVNAGDERVVFFNLGKINTAHSLASMMVQQAVFLIGK